MAFPIFNISNGTDTGSSGDCLLKLNLCKEIKLIKNTDINQKNFIVQETINMLNEKLLLPKEDKVINHISKTIKSKEEQLNILRKKNSILQEEVANL